MFRYFIRSWSSTAAAGLLTLSVAGAAGAAEPSLPPAPQWPAVSPAVSFGQFWAELDYLNWTVKGDRLPALVTSSPGSTPLAQAGVLGAPATSVLFGDSASNDGWRSGARLQAGYWFDAQQSSGIEASGFGIENASTGFATSASDNSFLATPFVNGAGNRDARLIARSGSSSGSIAVRELSQLLGASGLYRQNLWSWGGPSAGTAVGAAAIGAWGSGHIGVLVGYSYRYASDRLDIASTTVSGPVSTNTSDAFNATNNFHGLDIGLTGDLTQGRWSLEWRGKVALGANLNGAQMSGSTGSSGGVSVPAGGLLAPAHSNSSQIHFTAMPELSLKAGFQVASQWRIVASYEAMYWPGMRRAGNLVEAAANSSGSAPPPAGGPPPGGSPGSSSLLTQGFSVGLKYGY